jgi:hypothetical protein
MRNNKKGIGYKKERVVLSDILPYEAPPFFSNRYFYNFLVQNKVQLLDSKITFKKNSSDYIGKIIKLIFGLKFENNVAYDHKNDYAYFKINDNSFKTIPYKFRVSHKAKNYRELTVIHPINQLHLVSFYEKYKNNIIYYCNIGNFSLRRPSKIASLKYFKDSTFNKKKIINPEIEIIETTDKEYIGLKTFFSYQKYSNIYKFYESKEFHNAEKKFNKLLKFDISRCFDSIYSHSLPWALSNKKIVKDNLYNNVNTFGGIFDVLMQKMNHNETNGIVIGPEFSRIFAEMILQKIDADIEKELELKKYRFKVDYDIFRYVDDYFLFYSNDLIKEEILSLYELKLKEFNLFFNDSKTEKFEKPIITNITKAKEDIRSLIENTLIFKFFDKDDLPFSGITYHNSDDIITNYKKVLSQTKTSYKDLQNYFLATIFNKTKQLIKKYQGIEKKLIGKYIQHNKLGISILVPGLTQEVKDEINKELNELDAEIELDKNLLDKYYKYIHKKFLEIINLTFFVYTVLPRVSYSIKVCHILFIIIDFIKNQEKTKLLISQKPNQSFILKKIRIGLSFDNKHNVFKSIFDGIKIVLKKNREMVYSEIETLYLLAILNELGVNYELSEKTLIGHFNVNESNDMSYFLIISLLHHIKRKPKYNIIRDLLRNKIKIKFSKFESRKAEDTLLLIDVLTCPYVGITDIEVNEFRKEILTEIKFFKTNDDDSKKYDFLNQISNKEPNWFSNWEGSDLGKELNTKRGHSVY